MNTFLSIKEPCHQGWENMSVSEKGKFCSSCKKQVHDFSNSTIDEIKKAYSESEDGLCGHVSAKLLQEQYVNRNIQIEHLSFLKKFWIAAVFCFGASLFTIDSAKASTFCKIKTSLFKQVEATKDTIIVKGIVQDKNNHEKLPFVTISVMFNDSVIAKGITNINGEYQVKIPSKYLKVDMKADNFEYLPKIIKGITLSANKQIVVDFDLEYNPNTMLDGIMIMEETIPMDKPKKKKSK